MKGSTTNHESRQADRPALWLACAWASVGLLVSMAGHVAAGPRTGRADPSDAASQQDLAAVRADEAQRVEVFARAAKAVVCIFADHQRGGGGSGVVIDPEGYGLTNYHVVQPFIESRRGYGGLSDGCLYPLKVLGIDPGGDIAMFKLEGKQRFDYAALGDSNTLRVGQPVAAMGNPFVLAEDNQPTITLGIISGLHRYQEGQGNLLEYADCIQVSTSINPGNSGGPLFDLEGRVIGVNGRASFHDEEDRYRVNVGLGYAVSINQVRRFMPGLRAGRLLEHGTLGATVRTAGGDLIIGAIQAFSPAEKAGLQLGDELLEVAGRRVRTANDYNNIMATLPAGWPVALKLLSDGQPIETVARLERLPLRMPMLYVPDLEHNHAELVAILERGAQRTGMRLDEPVSHVTFTGRMRSGEAGGEQEFQLIVTADGGSSGGEVGRPGGPTPMTEQVAGDKPLMAALRAEWQEVALPLLVRPTIDLQWELLAGDGVDGRIVEVVERDLDSGRRVRWKFDWQVHDLLQVTIGDQDRPETIRWSPAEPTRFGELGWPRLWIRHALAGGTIVIEIESITPVSAAPRASPSDAWNGGNRE